MRTDFQRCIEDNTGRSIEEISATPINELLRKEQKLTPLQRLFGCLAKAIIDTGHAIQELTSFANTSCIQRNSNGDLVQIDPVSGKEIWNYTDPSKLRKEKKMPKVTHCPRCRNLLIDGVTETPAGFGETACIECGSRGTSGVGYRSNTTTAVCEARDTFGYTPDDDPGPDRCPRCGNEMGDDFMAIAQATDNQVACHVCRGVVLDGTMLVQTSYHEPV